MGPDKGFFASLFDYSFTSLITTRIIKIVYVLITVVFSIGAVIFLIAGISRGAGSAVASIILVPIGWLLYMIWARITLEVLIIIFRIGEDVRHIAYPYGSGPAYMGGGGYPPGPGGGGYPPGPGGAGGYPPGPSGPVPPPPPPPGGYRPPPAGPARSASWDWGRGGPTPPVPPAPPGPPPAAGPPTTELPPEPPAPPSPPPP